jgi:hypothetical protein
VFALTTREGGAFLMGRWYYLRGVSVMSGMAVIGAVIVAVAEPLLSAPVAGSVKYAYSVIV